MQSSALYLYVISSFVYSGQLGKISKSKCRYAIKIRFLILLLSIALGYMTSLFFIGIYDMSRAILNGTL